jgi:hypothetical protein
MPGKGQAFLVHQHDWHSTAYVRRWINNDVTRDDERRPVRLDAHLAAMKKAGFETVESVWQEGAAAIVKAS